MQNAKNQKASKVNGARLPVSKGEVQDSSTDSDISSTVKVQTTKGSGTPFHVTRCADCLYYQNNRHPSLDAPCSKLGRPSKGVAPPCFVPDIYVLKKAGTQFAAAFSVISNQLNSRQQKILGTLLLNAGKTKRVGFNFFQRVYFSVSNSNYLSNFYAGYVVGGTGDKNQIMVMGAKSTGTASVLAFLHKDSLLPEKAFREKRAQLVEKGKIYDPDFIRTKIRITKPDTYAPPVIDMNVEELEEAAAKMATKSKSTKTRPTGQTKTARTSRTADLVQLIIS